MADLYNDGGDFDFLAATIAGTERIEESEEKTAEEEETATSGNPDSEEEQQPKTQGLTPDIIAEARRLANSPTGLDYGAFYSKYGIDCPLDYLLYGKLDKDGRLI
jgi:ABC-type microcin C transport system permease subunit YejB